MNSKIIYIHGAFVGAKYSFLRDKLDFDGGFVSLGKELESKEAKLHYWAIDKKQYTFLECLNPVIYLKTYFREKDYVETKEASRYLQQTLNQTQPEIILSHSLGSRYLINFLKDNQLPKSVKKIYTFAGEMTQKDFQLNSEIEAKLKNKQLLWTNYYCFWDQALVTSSLLNLSPAIGLAGVNHNLIQNKFWALDLAGNPHTSALRDHKTLQKIGLTKS